MQEKSNTSRQRRKAKEEKGENHFSLFIYKKNSTTNKANPFFLPKYAYQIFSNIENKFSLNW